MLKDTSARIFIEPLQFPTHTGISVTIAEEDSHYLLKVLRLPERAPIALLDGLGNYATGILLFSQGKTQVLVQDIVLYSVNERKPKLILCQGLLKGEKFDWLVEKATELGISHLFPYWSQHTVQKEDLRKSQQEKQNRWQRLATMAARQCGRLVLPMIEAPTTLRSILQQPLFFSSTTQKLLFWEKEPLAPWPKLQIEAETVILIVGPEGGLSQEEVDLCLHLGFTPCGLGENTLRAETAGMLALGLTQHLLRF